MNTCSTCKHWNSIDGLGNQRSAPRLRGPGYDAWDGPVAEGQWGWCTKVAEFGPRSAGERFYVNDGSEYRADLNTRSDFGCVEHEPNESEQ